MTVSRPPGRSRKGKSGAQASNYSQLYKRSAGDTVTTPTVAATTPVALKGSESVAWEREYDYVLKDLRKLLLVTLILFALIIAAGFVL